MTSAVVYEGVERGHDDNEEIDDEHEKGQLFSGYKLWFSRQIPQRNWFVTNAQLNGADIVPLEKQADVCLVDHARKNQPPGTYSYRWVEQSIRKGQLEELGDHAVGYAVRADRPVGSVITQPRTGARAAYTAEEDQFLWNVMRPYVDRGGSWKGNEIYKQIERIRPRHTFQSWRDRWIKYTQHQKRTLTEDFKLETPEPRVTTRQQEAPNPQRGIKRGRNQVEVAENVTDQSSQVRTPLKKLHVEEASEQQVATAVTPKPSTQLRGEISEARSPPLEFSVAIRTPTHEGGKRAAVKPPSQFPFPMPDTFSVREANMLYKATPSIISGNPEKRKLSWAMVSKNYTSHTAEEWEEFWRSFILPVYFEKEQAEADEGEAEIERQTVELQHRRAEIKGVEQELILSGHIKPTTPRPSVNAEPSSSQKPRAESGSDHQTCSNCFTDETIKWRKDREGRPLCNDCGIFLKQNGVLRPSMPWTEPPEEDKSPTMTPAQADVGVQTSPLLSALEPSQSQGNPGSPMSQSSSRSRPPEPNEARKRRAGKSSQSNSQDSKSSKESKSGMRKKDDVASLSPDLPAVQTTPTRQKRKAQLKDEPFNLEIPPTPEQTISQGTAVVPRFSEIVDTSPSMRSQRRHSRDEVSISHSPLFFPEGRRSATPMRGRILGQIQESSPLKLDLVGDVEQLDPQASEEDLSDTGSVATTYAFDTAPDVSEHWETAPETPIASSDGVTEHGQTESQPLPYESETLRADFTTLPELDLPEEELIEVPSDNEQQSDGPEGSVAELGGAADRSSSQPIDIDSWIAAQTKQHPNTTDLDVILHTAIEATSFHFDIAEDVVRAMIESRNAGEAKASSNGGTELPHNIPGCWTAEDDNFLFSQNAREVDVVEKKHGKDSCNFRFEFLEAWAAS